jgi:predicted Zn-dependent protease
MAELEPPDLHHLRGAAGWLELGNLGEAWSEFAKIAPRQQEHPDVLELRWRLQAEAKDWTAALETAQRLVALDPKNPAGWINQSYTLHEMRRTTEARDELLAVAEEFGQIATVPYNLACYACQLGARDEAWRWLEQAIRLRGREAIKALALADPDLRPLHAAIETL